MNEDAIELDTRGSETHSQLCGRFTPFHTACPATQKAQTCQLEDGLRVGSTEWTEMLNLTICTIFETLWLCENEVNHACTARYHLLWFLLWHTRQIGHFHCGHSPCIGRDAARTCMPTQQVSAQVLDPLVCNGEASSLCVTSVAFKEIGVGVQGQDDVEAIGTTCRTTTVHLASAQYEYRSLEFFNKFACHQANNAFRPIVPTHQDYWIVGVSLYLFTDGVHQCFCLLLARNVERFQFIGVTGGLRVVIGRQELKGDAGILHASCCVDTWCQDV